jgi:hypothetical protein
MAKAAEAAKSALPMVPAERVSPLEFLDNVINSQSPEVDARLKVTAAGIAARYLHAPPKSVDPADVAKPITIEGTTVPEWTEREEQRMRFLFSISYVPGLSDAEKREYDALQQRKVTIERQRLTAQPWTPADAARLAELQKIHDQHERNWKQALADGVYGVALADLCEASERDPTYAEYSTLRARWFAMTAEGAAEEKRERVRWGL